MIQNYITSPTKVNSKELIKYKYSSLHATNLSKISNHVWNYILHHHSEINISWIIVTKFDISSLKTFPEIDLIRLSMCKATAVLHALLKRREIALSIYHVVSLRCDNRMYKRAKKYRKRKEVPDILKTNARSKGKTLIIPNSILTTATTETLRNNLINMKSLICEDEKPFGGKKRLCCNRYHPLDYQEIQEKLKNRRLVGVVGSRVLLMSLFISVLLVAKGTLTLDFPFFRYLFLPFVMILYCQIKTRNKLLIRYPAIERILYQQEITLLFF